MVFYIRFRALHLPSHFHKFPSFFCCSSYSSISTSVQKNPAIFNYLVETLSFPKASALAVSERFPSLAKLEKTVHLLRTLGFSDAQIQSTVRTVPPFLFSDIEKVLKPKLMFFQELGFSDVKLCDFISKNPHILNRSLKNRIIPCMMIIKEVLENGRSSKLNNNDITIDLFLVLSRCCWLIPALPRFLSNISYFKSCGIVGYQLSIVLKRQPRLFLFAPDKIKKRFNEILGMGFQIGSPASVRCIMGRCGVTDESFNKKYELFLSYGFSKNEFLEMFRKSPTFINLSEKSLRSLIEFFLNFLNLDKSVIVHRPLYLTFSMEKRVMLRYKVLELLKSKGLLKKEPRFLKLLELSNEKFLEDYVLKFGIKVGELQLAHNNQVLNSS